MALVAVSQQMVGKSRDVSKRLDGRVEVAGVAKIKKASHSVKKDARVSFKMETAHALFANWAPIINKNQNSPNIEIEIRLGTKGAKNFETDVGKATFDKVLKALTKYEGWEAKTIKQYAVYYGQEGRRVTVDEDTDETVAVIKKRVTVNDFTIEGSNLDCRLGVATEVPYERDVDNEVMESVKSKKRWSFIRKNLSIDLSIVKGDPDDPDADSDTTYQIEMEIIDPTKVKTRDEMFNILYKVFDLIKCV